jgi:hypothetical protein
MDAIRYDQIEPNIGRVAVSGSQVQVSWKCAVSGRQVGESAAYMTADRSLGTQVGASVKRNIVSEIVYGIARFIGNLLGGVAGRVVSNAAHTAAADVNARATAGVDYSEASRQAAIVNAFDSVKQSFAWDDARRRFVAK